jgi:hypothetical protein
VGKEESQTQAIAGLELGARDLTSQHLQLVPEHQEFGLLILDGGFPGRSQVRRPGAYSAAVSLSDVHRTSTVSCLD